MKQQLKNSIMSLILVIISCIIGCGGDDYESEAPFSLESITPEPGSEILENDTIHITFSGNPGEVTASTGTVSGNDRSRQIAGPFLAGALALTIEWTNGNGSATFEYSVILIDKTSVEE